MTKRPAAHAKRTRKIGERATIPDFINRPNEPQAAFAKKANASVRATSGTRESKSPGRAIKRRARYDFAAAR